MPAQVQRIRVKFKDGTWDTYTVTSFGLESGIYYFIFENGTRKEFPQGTVHELDIVQNLQEMNS